MNADGRRIDRESAERLLDAVSARPRPDDPGPGPEDPLARLLAAAAVPADPAELAGEDAAVTAFRVHTATPAPRARPTSLLPVRLAVAALAVVAASGVLTVTDADPLSLIRQGPDDPTAATGPSASATSSAGPGPGGASGPSPLPSAPVDPEPGTVRLCRAYTTAAQADPRAARADPAFSALVTQAGGSQHVTGYCTQVLQAAARNGAGGGPKSSGPNGNPSDRPSDRPSGKPSEKGKGKENKPDTPGGSPQATPPAPDKPGKSAPRKGSPDSQGDAGPPGLTKKERRSRPRPRTRPQQ